MKRFITWRQIQLISYLGGSLAAFIGVQAPRAAHAINIFLDYTNFETRLTELTASAGIDPFSPNEVNTLQSGILSGLNQAYSDFTVNFTDIMPMLGPFETLNFGLTSDPRSLGLADQIDFRNQTPDDLGRIYTANFSIFVNEFSGRIHRPVQIKQLTAALVSTSVHELGHNLGLQHQDAYGDPRITPANYTNTMGIQNTHIMATGPTGLTLEERETAQTFSTLSTAKLEYAEGLTKNGPPKSFKVTAASQSTTGQPLSFIDLPISGVQATNLIGDLSNFGETDLFSFEGTRGSLFTASLLSASLFPEQVTNPIDSIINLLDQDRNVLAISDATLFGPNQFNQGPVGIFDSSLLNFVLPSTERYFLAVRAISNSFRPLGVDIESGVGDYELFVTQQEIPDRSTGFGWVLAGIVGYGVLKRQSPSPLGRGV